MKRQLKIVAVAALVLGVLVTPVSAAETSDVPVSYDNRNVIEDPNGVWGVVVPTAVTFTDTKTTQNVDVELVGMNGYTLTDFTNPSFAVNVDLKSLNSYKLLNGTIEAEYNVVYGSLTLDNANAAEASIATLTATANEQTGTANLTKKPTAKGTYTDTLTYTVTATGSPLN